MAVRAYTSPAGSAVLFRVCGDLSGVTVDGTTSRSAKCTPAGSTSPTCEDRIFCTREDHAGGSATPACLPLPSAVDDFASTGAWWRARMAAAVVMSPKAHAVPLFDAAGGAAAWHVAVHIRRGDMVYRNFASQLSPDAYYVNAMAHVLMLAHAAEGGAAGRKLVFHVFSQRPPLRSWTGAPKVPHEGRHTLSLPDCISLAPNRSRQEQSSPSCTLACSPLPPSPPSPAAPRCR